jgi:undecaprenyl-diphosphatase
MRALKEAFALPGLTSFDLWVCTRLAGAARPQATLRFLRAVSRLGNGLFWYALMAALPLLYGAEAWPVVGRMVMVGLVCLLLYRWIKAKTGRPRPYMRHAEIIQGAAALDQYSFPSGHTLHAVSFSILVVARFPELAWVLAPLSALIALSRIVLGLHYPSDVAAGALLGALLAGLGLYLL